MFQMWQFHVEFKNPFSAYTEDAVLSDTFHLGVSHYHYFLLQLLGNW